MTQMAEQVNVFYGYPSTPPFVGESIESATNQLQASPAVIQDRVNFRLWPEIRASGKVLAREIMKSIDEADVFACDLTYPNANVKGGAMKDHRGGDKLCLSQKSA